MAEFVFKSSVTEIQLLRSTEIKSIDVAFQTGDY